MKLNCWDFKKCGRILGEQQENDLGICPVITYKSLDGIHGGINAGRACWVIAGSLCGGKVQGNEEQKRAACWQCDFLHLVRKEEEPEPNGFSHTRLGMDKVIEKINKK